MTFEEMLKALMNGKKIRKKAWDRGIYRMRGDGKYIIDQEGNESAILIDGSFDADVWEEYKEDLLSEIDREFLRKLYERLYPCISFDEMTVTEVDGVRWLLLWQDRDINVKIKLNDDELVKIRQDKFYPLEDLGL